MRKIKLVIEYEGTAYNGWQIQKQGTTIQGIIEKNILKITGERIRLTGASRTDSGVHALGQVAAFTTDSNLLPDTIKRALNALLPVDIRVLDVCEMDMTFHPGKNALKKIYFYLITNRTDSLAFLYRYIWSVKHLLDLNSMTRALRFVVGRHDFSSFMGTGSGIKNPVREVFSVNIERREKIDFLTATFKGEFFIIRIEADGFLRHMMRNIVGTLVEIGRGRAASDVMKEILSSRDRKRAGPTAPPQGLFLERIVY